MKKKLLWALTLVLFALFPYQNAKASLVQLDRSGWTVTASSEETSGEGTYRGYASNIKDGNTDSFWHSRYTGGDAAKPHWIMINLGSVQTIDAFNYVSRMANNTGCNGNIENYKLYISTSAPTTTNIAGTMQEVASGEFSYTGSNTEHLITLNNSVEAQYVLLYAVSTHGSIDDTYANCSEFYLYKNDYCAPSGNMTNKHASGTALNRKFTSFTLSDGTNSVSLDNIQTSYTDAMYKDRTTDVLETTAGATLNFTAMSSVDWMHAYVYIDYDRDKTFDTTANNDGTTDGELVSYNYYNGKNINNGSMAENCGVSAANIPSWTLPSDLDPGTYRLRFKVDWNSIDPCGASGMASNNGCVVDITLEIEDTTPSNEKKQNLFSSANISQANNIYPYRIPGITSTNKEGRLIATAARLVCGTDPGYGRVDAVCRISDDNGVTWGDEKTIATGTGRTSASENYFDTAYGDPAVIADRESGEVIVIVVAGCTVYGNSNTNRDNPNKIGIIRSTDYGDTWGTPVDITEQIYSLYDSGNTIQAAFVAGGKVFQSRIVKVGQYYRLYAAMCARPNGNRVIYSDDFGRTWKALGGASAVLTPENGNEPKCEELPDGRVILSSRNANGNGRIYNIYTYTNTTTGEGSWSSPATSTFEGSNQAPGSNNTNGEILIVPVKRNSDSKDMYLALQSQPTGNSRVNVGIYYKELTNLDDMNTVANFATGWNGFYQVSTTESAYSSMDLQDDGKVGFFYEETLTRDGTVSNPLSTNFTDESNLGTHNFDGYNNIYRAYTIEQLTNNAYTLKTDVNRGDFVKTYLTSEVNASTLPTATKTELTTKIDALGDEPATSAVDEIYSILNQDPWDGKIVTFTNIQSNGDQRALYVNNSILSLGTTSQTAASLGSSAQFLCEKRADGKYSFKNIATNEYMIWRATDGSTYSYNNNKGTLSSYEAPYCDWTLTDTHSTKANTYCMVSKRSNRTDDGSLCVAESSGAFDSFGATPICGTHTNGSNYSNVYYINIVELNGERTITVAVSSSDTEKGEVAIEGTNEKTITSSEIVTITATANAGYKFVKWTVDDVEVGTSATYTDATSGDKTYTAHFAPLTATDKYALIEKPQYSTVGNVNYITNAEISENSVGVAPGVIDLSEIPSVTGSGYTRQRGVTDVIEAEAGADIYLTLTIAINWGGMKFYQLNKGNVEKKVYGQYGPIGAANAEKFWSDIETASQTDNGIIVEKDQNKVSFRFTFAKEDVQEGDIVVIRAMSANAEVTSPNSSTLTEGTYIDFLFEIVGEAVPHTVKVVVTPSEGGSATINGEERTQIEASGIVSLSATPKDGYRFLSWTDNNGKLISENANFTKPIVADTTYRANFVKVWDVTATSNNQEWGTVTIDGKNSEGSVDHATTITLTAEPTTGGKFIHWTLNDEPISTQNPFKTTILKDEVYQAVFEKDYPTVKLKYTGDERQINRYLKSMTAVAGELTTIAFDADSETSLPRVDAEYTAFDNSGSSTATPTTTGALIDKTANPIKVKQETETIALTFKQWPTAMKNGITTDSEAQLVYTQQAIFVDWNGDKDFADTDEAYDKSSDAETNGTFASAEGYTRSITVPQGVQPGVYRMRVVYHEPVGAYTSDWRGDFKETTSTNIVTNGKVYDFAIEIVADKNYITFTAPGGTYFKMGETADVTLTYPLEGSKIYYTTNGFDPDENSAVIDNGGKVALNTFNEGVVTIKARAYDPENGSFCSSVYSAAYNISSNYTSGYVPKTTYNANTTTIVGAAISDGVGIENGTINHNFEQGQQTATTPISVAADATFNLDVTLNLKWYGIKIHRIDFTDSGATGSLVKSYIGSYADEVNATKFESDLTTAGYTFTKDGDQYTVSIPVSIKKGENELSEGSSVVYRIIVTADINNDALAYNYGDGEYVDFMFNVQPQSSITKLAGTATKDLNITVKTTDACYLQVGGYSQNLPEAQTLTIPASLNAAGEMDIQVVGAEIEKMDIEVLEIGTNVLLPDVEYLGEVTLKSSAKFSATTISHASVLPKEGIKVVVEKEIFVPYEIDGKMPTYFNFLSMPFDFDPGVNIEFFHPTEKVWKPATIEKDIRVLTYKSATRANGQAYYNQTWNTFGGTGGLIYANQGFVLVGNSDYGDAEHKMKLRFKSFYAEQAQPGQEAVTRETIYKQDGSAKTITANRYRNSRGETHPLDADWQHVGSPYLTHSDGIDYVLYYHDGYKYVSVGQTENPTISAFQSVMFQANLGGLPEQEIIMTPLSIGAKTNAANGVYGRANLAINDDECVKIVLKDDASENFVVNEDAWYMAPTANVFSTMSVNVAGSEASISVQPEPTELPLTVYAGSKAQQTISLSRYDGEVNIFLKDAVTDETVCLNDEDYTFTATPYSTIADRFTVSMIEPTGITESVAEATIKAVVTGNTIKLYGTEEGDQVSLYTANGMLITNAVAQDSETSIETSATGVIIIKVAEETIKVVK